MAGLTIHSEKLTPALAKEPRRCARLGRWKRQRRGLAVGAGCKMCRLCIKKARRRHHRGETKTADQQGGLGGRGGICGFCTWEEAASGHAGAAGQGAGVAAVTGHPVYALLLGGDTQKQPRNCCATGPTECMYTITQRWLDYHWAVRGSLPPILLKT